MAKNERIGCYVIQTTAGEAFSAYIPAPLLPVPEIDLGVLASALEKASAALAELNALSCAIPNTFLFVYMQVRKEALLSSQIEGTQSSLSDLLLFENKQTPNVSLEDVEEVSHYVKAIYHGIERLRDDDFPISLRLLKEMHAILLSGGRGKNQSPGEFRKSQNWIGGTRPGNALFVPPPVDHLADCLSNFELFLHYKNFPVLVKAAIAHVQFETIHPFLDGNGRLGRLLMCLLLMNEDLLNEPVLYVSLYLKQHRRTYYALLQEVREHGRWEVWIEFFLKAITESSKKAVSVIHTMSNVFLEDEEKIRSLGRVSVSCLQVFEYIKKMPQVSVKILTSALELSAPSVRTVLSHLEELDIIHEITGKKSAKVYVYTRYLSLLEEDAEPL